MSFKLLSQLHNQDAHMCMTSTLSVTTNCWHSECTSRAHVSIWLYSLKNWLSPVKSNWMFAGSDIDLHYILLHSIFITTICTHTHCRLTRPNIKPVLVLHWICQSAQFAKCAVQFRNSACAIRKFLTRTLKSVPTITVMRTITLI